MVCFKLWISEARRLCTKARWKDGAWGERSEPTSKPSSSWTLHSVTRNTLNMQQDLQTVILISCFFFLHNLYAPGLTTCSQRQYCLSVIHLESLFSVYKTNKYITLSQLYVPGRLGSKQFSFPVWVRESSPHFTLGLPEYPGGPQVSVWLLDGNIWYLSAKHIPLFLAGLATLLPCFSPYTLFLLRMLANGQWMLAWSDKKMLSWVSKPGNIVCNICFQYTWWSLHQSSVHRLLP